MRLVLFVLLLVYSFSAYSQIKTATVIDTVKCQFDKTQSYALYLPSNYSEGNKYPAIYFFEPAARGKLPIELYHQVAEEMGYILISSNNSRNGSWDVGFAAGEAMFKDTRERFSIDNNRLYTSGFSGGSRLALAVAVLTKQIKGVIGVGAAQPPVFEYGVRKSQNFKYAGLVGNRDMNYQEHKMFTDYLDALEMPNLLLISALDHNWAPAIDFQIALMWMEQGDTENAAGSQSKDLSELFESKRTALADSIFIFDWLSMEEDLVMDKGNSLQEEKDLKRLKRDDLKIRELETSIRSEIQDSLNAVYNKGIASRTFIGLKRKVQSLKAKMIDSKQPEDRLMFSRLVNFVFAMTYETSIQNIQLASYDKAAIGFELMGAVSDRPGTSLWWLAKVYALKQDESKCLDYLEALVNQGFNKLEMLNAEPVFEKIRNSSRYSSIVQKITP